MPITSPPLVSVIIPCYNVSAYVEKAINSIVSQTYKNLEIWIIDDASTDDTLQKINSVRDERIRIMSFKKNTQKVGAVNEVLQKINGEFIAFQDADDWSEPNRIEEQVKTFHSYSGLGVCFTKYRYAGGKAGLPKRIAITNEELRDEFLEFGNKKNKEFEPTSCPTMMITKEALQKTSGYHPYFGGRVAEDIQWIYRILKEFKGITVDQVLYNYSVREGSFTEIQHSGKNAKYAYSWQLLNKIIYKDVHENVDILDDENRNELKALELQSCEEALLEQILRTNRIEKSYKESMSYRIGKVILMPFQILGYKKRSSN